MNLHVLAHAPAPSLHSTLLIWMTDGREIPRNAFDTTCLYLPKQGPTEFCPEYDLSMRSGTLHVPFENRVEGGE